MVSKALVSLISSYTDDIFLLYIVKPESKGKRRKNFNKELIEELTNHGRINIIEYLVANNIKTPKNLIVLAAENKNCTAKLIKYIYSVTGFVSYTEFYLVYKSFVNYNNLDCIIWISSIELKLYGPSDSIWLHCTDLGRLDLLKWALAHNKLRKTQSGYIDYAVDNKQYATVVWLIQNKFAFNYVNIKRAFLLNDITLVSCFRNNLPRDVLDLMSEEYKSMLFKKD